MTTPSKSPATATSARRPIRQLTASVINKIAAGEVIERPASVVKELLENSVDAGASQIEVALEQGGIELIRITDNGSGIPQDELRLAVTSHATSKIEDVDELFRVHSFGFRGEALASIAEVSQMTIRSRTADQDSGFELRVNGGQHEPIEPCGCPVGTTIEVRQLFYNTPVRRKFLRTTQTEKGHIAEAFTRVALAHPGIQMTLLHNGSVVHNLPPTDIWGERISAFFGPEICDALIPVANSDGQISVQGFVVNPSITRSNNKMQYLFLNGRYIKDRSLQHALGESYRGLIMTNRYPICFLRLELPFELVDVNVHPAKLEVRFQNGGQIYSHLLSTLRNKFLSTDLTAQAQLNRPETVGWAGDRQSYPAGPAAQGSATEQQDQFRFPPAEPLRDWTQAPRDPFATSTPGSPAERLQPLHHQAVPATTGFGDHQPATAAPNRQLAMQVHNTYLITETDEGMVVIDQHALHERIIYEQLRGKVLSGKLETQKLLVPEPVTLPPSEAALVLDRAALLQQIGMDVEPFGGDTVLVTAYPAMLANHNPAEMLRSVIDKLQAEGSTPDQRDLVDELLHMISCKAAVKAGDQLTPEEIQSLIEHRELCQDSHHCPHGRPTSLVFSREDLDRRFKRI